MIREGGSAAVLLLAVAGLVLVLGLGIADAGIAFSSAAPDSCRGRCGRTCRCSSDLSVFWCNGYSCRGSPAPCRSERCRVDQLLVSGRSHVAPTRRRGRRRTAGLTARARCDHGPSIEPSRVRPDAALGRRRLSRTSGASFSDGSESRSKVMPRDVGCRSPAPDQPPWILVKHPDIRADE